MKYTLQEVTKKDCYTIYNLKKSSIYNFVEKIWGWDEQYQLDDFKTDFKDVKNFSVIKVGNDKVGFLQVALTTSSIHIVELHLQQVFQGKGIGTSIIKEIIQEARNCNKNIFVGCFKDNEKAKRLYLRMGFAIVGETASHYEFQFIQ